MIVSSLPALPSLITFAAAWRVHARRHSCVCRVWVQKRRVPMPLLDSSILQPPLSKAALASAQTHMHEADKQAAEAVMNETTAGLAQLQPAAPNSRLSGSALPVQWQPLNRRWQCSGSGTHWQLMSMKLMHTICCLMAIHKHKCNSHNHNNSN